MRAQVVLILTLLLSGCTSSYQPDRAGGGFSTKPLADDTYAIVYEGGYQTAKSLAVEFTLLRAAELAKSSGFSHFQVLTAEADLETLTITKPAYIRSIQGSSSHFHTWVNLADDAERKHEKPRVVMVVKFMDDAKAADYVFPAEAVIAEIRSKHNISNSN